MSDLSRLRKRLANLERTGKRRAAELAEIKAEVESQPGLATRNQLNRIDFLDKMLNLDRKEWRETWQQVRAEELRLLNNPDAPLRFT